MNSFLKLFLLGSLLLTHFASAQEISKDFPLKLLGPGLVDKSTGNSIAIACEEEACKNLRFVYFDASTQTNSWVGEPMIAPTADDEKTLQKAYQLTIESYLDYHSRDLARKMDRQAKIAFFLGGIGMAVLFLTLPESPTTFLLGAAYATTVGYLVMSHKTLSALCGNGKIYSNTINQEGWNWSINAKPLKHKHFAGLSTQIRSGVRPFDRDSFELFDRYQKQRNKLTKKGANFTIQKYE